MRKSVLSVAVVSLVACSPEDLAALQPRGKAAVNELSHQVGVRFEDGAAVLRVKRTLRNDSLEFQALTHHLPLPEGAIATSLRVGTDGRFPEPGRLTSSEDAQASWDLLTRPGDAAPSTLGMLQWSWGGGLDLDLFALAPGSTVSVEYDVELSADYAAGELSFDYPMEPEGEGFLPPRFEVPMGALTQDEASFRLRQARGIQDVAEARWATYPVDTDRTLWRLEVDVAAELERAPVRPNVVFVVDASHSEGVDGIAAQLELIAPYLENARDAQVEVVLYRRFAERLFGQFVPAHDVARRLASIPAEQLAPANGSNLELGAGLAAQLLSQAGGVGRIVLFTDEQLRDGFSNDVAISALSAAPNDTIVHVVERSGWSSGALNEHRDDDSALSPIATARGGIFLRVAGHAMDPVLSADTLLGLVRPVRIDSFVVEAKGVPDDQLAVDGTLAEGGTVRQEAICAQPPSEVTLTGKIWARDFRRVVTVDPGLANRLPGIAVGSDQLRMQLSDDELRTVAFVSHAVSPVTSYLAISPDAAPSTIGLSEGEIGGLGLRGVGCGGCGGSSTCGWGKAGRGVDLQARLSSLLAPGIAACEQRHAVPAMGSLRLEATSDEVVAVDVVANTSGLAECVTEAAWALRLSPEFRGHRHFEIGLSR